MTRNNLDSHLRWLISTKPSLPPEVSLPPVTASFSIGAAHLDEIEDIPDGAFDDDISEATTEAPEEPASQAAPLQTGRDLDMARLRAAPGSASKPRLISVGAGSQPESKTTTTEKPLSKWKQTVQSAAKVESVPQTPIKKEWNFGTSEDDVEVMDLTDSLNQLKSPSLDRAVKGGGSARKRKSEEYRADLNECPRHGSPASAKLQRTSPNPALVGGKSRHCSNAPSEYTSIDEVMDEAPSEPPPPYSTVAPRPPLRSNVSASRSRAVQQNGEEYSRQRTVMPDSEDEDEDNIISLTEPARRASPSRKVPTTSASVKEPPVAPSARQAIPERLSQTASPSKPGASAKAPSSSDIAKAPGTQDSESALSAEDRTRLDNFFNLSSDAIKRVLQDLEAQYEEITEDIATCFDNDDEAGADAKSKELDQAESTIHALKSLQSMPEERDRLSAKKQEAFEKMRQAIKTRVDLPAAKETNRQYKVKLAEFELKCLQLLNACEGDLNKCLRRVGAGRQTTAKSVAVMASQAAQPTARSRAMEPPSPTRIAQTQAPSNAFDHLAAAEKQRSVDRQLSMAPPARTDYASRKENSRPQQHVTFSNDINDTDDFFDEEEQLFSNRMGTPPAAFSEHYEDFGGDDDDDMAQFADDIENQGLPEKPSDTGPTRPVFGETSANSHLIPSQPSAKKSRKSQAVQADADVEDLFRFPWSDDVAKALKHRFKLKGFRQGQIGAINATLGGKDVFVLMPTGGGKSLCYQLPSLITSGKTRGVTVVISPLLSLMEDQVQHLRSLHIQAYLINSETRAEERRAIFDAFQEPNVQDFVQCLYVTPEMLSKSQAITNAFGRLYNRGQLARLVIDEAHCVSQWGHDFRPDYKLIGDVRRQFPKLPVIALTATATENVKVDVIHNLGIDGCEVFARSFNRPNLYYEVRQKGKGKEDLEAIASLIQNNHRGQTGIIYCLSRKNCEDLAKALSKEHRIRAHHFHAGMDPAEKSTVQKKWQAGQYHVIVATIAFGMGIDKANVRYVIHHSMPKSLEGYYQETGRAGRDGKNSSCYLFYGYQDAGKLRRMIDDGEGSREQKDRQHQMLRKMTSYCDNRAVCRRVQVLSYFSERFDAADCNYQCDNCNSTSTFEERDLTDYALGAINLLEELQGEKVTLLYCIDVFRGAQIKKITDAGHNRLENHGRGKGLDRGDIERMFNELLGEGALKEYNEVNRSGFANQYMQLGPRAIDFKRGRRKLKIQVCMSPTGKAKALLKKATAKDGIAKKSKQSTTSKPRAELPESTYLSSPIQQATTNRKQSRQPQLGSRFGGYANDNFVVPDDDDDEDYVDGDDESDGFEPIREGRSMQQPPPKRRLGQRITADATMGSLTEIHRFIVDDFVRRAKEVVERIKNDHFLHSVPFSDTILRQMAIRFTETEEDMLSIPDIDAARVRLFGRHFTKLVRECRRQYNEMNGGADDAQILDPNLQNVIDLVSDDDEDNDEYGPSINGSDVDDDDEGESSGYFQQDPAVQAFNQRFANSQLTNVNSYAAGPSQSQTGRKSTAKPRKQKWKARGSTSYGNRKASGGGSRAAGSRTSGRGGATSGSKVSKRTATTGGASKRGGAGASGGFSMMPT